MKRFLKSIAILFTAVPVGIMIYFFTGIAIARVLNTGRFYSVPFGGFEVGGHDGPLLASAVFWILLSSLVIYLGIGLITRKPAKP